RGGRGGYSNVSSARSAKPASAAKPVPAVASTSVSDSASGWDVEPTSDTKATAAAWGAKSSSNGQNTKPKSNDKAPASSSSTAAAAASSSGKVAPAKPAPMSWASIAKRGVKQTVPDTARLAESEKKASEAASKVLDGAAIAGDGVPAKEPVQETAEPKPAEEPVAEETDTAEQESKVVISETVVTTVEVVETEPTQVILEQVATEQIESAAVPEIASTESQTASASSKKPASTTRRLNQDAPVVMPTGSSSLERIGMQFGSLSIGGVDLGSLSTSAAAELEKPAESATVESAASHTETKETAPAPAPVPAPVSVPVPVAAQVPVTAAESAANLAASEPAATATANQGPLTAYLQQQQQQQQQNIGNQSQAYPNVSAISQMPLPNDYGAAALYGTEPRNVMGFYDNYGYGQFVANKDTSAASASTESQTATTSGPQAAGINGANNLGQAGLFPQQIPQPFGMTPGMPWPQSYYYGMMQPGNQFHNPAAYGNNPALAAAYGQPFMKQQGMYMMYPGANPQGLQGVGTQQQQQQQPQQQGGQQQPQQPQQPGQQGAA
ncbi:hypothetical protein LPJ73_005650, partial [Coemansia sp. RSA 2703]